MTTAVDTNILAVLWDPEDRLNIPVRAALDGALEHGSLIVAAPVYAELLGFPSRNEAFLNYFFKESGIFVDWDFGEAIWRAAGHAFQSYVTRRRKQRDAGPRRILTDFLIGAHAMSNGFSLLTLDDRIYRAAFPRLTIVNPQNI